jgi:hypothetical protein
MRLLPVALLCMQALFFMPALHTQNIDSLARSVDSSSMAIEKITKDLDSFTKESQQVPLRRQTTQNSKNLDQFLADMKEREKREKRQAYIRIGLGVAFVIVLFIALARRRKLRDGEA